MAPGFFGFAISSLEVGRGGNPVQAAGPIHSRGGFKGAPRGRAHPFTSVEISKVGTGVSAVPD